MAVEHRLLGYSVTKASWRGTHYSGQRFEDMVLLAHFDSDIRMDFDWHDDLEFWIGPEDLANGDFSNVIAWQWS